jgi:hypothetical protein
MARDTEKYQPGRMLYGVLIGAFRMKGTTFQAWCKERGVGTTTARAAAYGLSRAPASQKILDEMIDFAGRDTVLAAYRDRVAEHAREMSAAAKETRRA